MDQRGFSRVVAPILGTFKLARRSFISLLVVLNRSIICSLSYISKASDGGRLPGVPLGVKDPQSWLQKCVPRSTSPSL